MELRALTNTSRDEIVAAFIEAFKDYPVTFPTDAPYWERRFRGARVDHDLSFGVFDHGKLVAYIVVGLDNYGGQLTAYNAGTGVIEEYRGNKLVDQLYDYAIPHFKDRGVTQCLLEVITTNARAIRVYERIGFHKVRTLKCFKGLLANGEEEVTVAPVGLSEAVLNGDNDRFYSWDNVSPGVLILDDYFKGYSVQIGGQEKGRFAMIPEKGFIAQIQSTDQSYDQVMAGVASIAPEILINNVDESRHDLIEGLKHAGAENFLDQHEMAMTI